MPCHEARRSGAAYGRQMTRLSRLPHYRLLALAVKAGVATGIAYYLGSLLPSPLDEYKYYAALGAFTVVGLFVVDSTKESLRVLAAVSLGVAVAVAAQALAWTNPLTVALVVLSAALLGGIPGLGQQRDWAPLAALFVLATGGPDPGPMALGYVTQVPLGAAVGIVVNILLLAPLGSFDLEDWVRQMREILGRQMRRYAELLEDQLDDPRDPEAVEARSAAFRENIQELQLAQAHLLRLMSDGQRAQRGNPRARLSANREALALERAEAISRCTSALGAAAVILDQAEPADGDGGRRLRRDGVELLRQSADVLDSAQPRQRSQEMLQRTRESLDRMLQRVHAVGLEEGLDHVLFGALAVSVWRCLETFERQVADSV